MHFFLSVIKNVHVLLVARFTALSKWDVQWLAWNCMFNFLQNSWTWLWQHFIVMVVCIAAAQKRNFHSKINALSRLKITHHLH